MIEHGLKNTIENANFLTFDLGGECTTSKFVDQVINEALKYKVW